MITLRRQVELETIFLLAMIAAGSVFFAIYRNNNYQPQFSIVSTVPSSSLVSSEIVSPKVTISSQISPDGVKKVVMKVTENSDGTKTYDISTADENGANEQYIFSKILIASDNLRIPFNAWSPDDKYFFIQGSIDGNKSVMAFNVSGAPFANAETFLDVTNLFTQKNTGNNFDEATGWASETLIIINTRKPEGEKGFSYWFEVPSKAVIQLSTEF